MGFSELASSNFSIPDHPPCLVRGFGQNLISKEGQRPGMQTGLSAECSCPQAPGPGPRTGLLKDGRLQPGHLIPFCNFPGGIPSSYQHGHLLLLEAFSHPVVGGPSKQPRLWAGDTGPRVRGCQGLPGTAGHPDMGEEETSLFLNFRHSLCSQTIIGQPTVIPAQSLGAPGVPKAPSFLLFPGSLHTI